MHFKAIRIRYNIKTVELRNATIIYIKSDCNCLLQLDETTSSFTSS